VAALGIGATSSQWLAQKSNGKCAELIAQSARLLLLVSMGRHVLSIFSAHGEFPAIGREIIEAYEQKPEELSALVEAIQEGHHAVIALKPGCTEALELKECAALKSKLLVSILPLSPLSLSLPLPLSLMPQ